MKILFTIFKIFVILFISKFLFADEYIISKLSNEKISISANFDGSDVTIYGAINLNKSTNDLLIEVIGPKTSNMIMKKEKKIGIWINRNTKKVINFPDFYAIAGTKDIDILIDNKEKRIKGIGINQIIQNMNKDINLKEIKAAILRINVKREKYSKKTLKIDLEKNILFSTLINFPPNLVEGNYITKMHVIKNGKVINTSETQIEVRKVGIEKWLKTIAYDQPLLYGLLSLFLAISFGWIASEVFRLVRR